MKTLNITEIIAKALELSKERGFNLFFSENGNIIEGCRNRKSSETYEYDVKRGYALYDTTANDIATEIIEEAIKSLQGEEENIEIQFEETEKEIETSEMNLNPCNQYFLRFTAEAVEDLRRGTSLFKTGSMNEAVELQGLCGFEIDLVGLTKSEIEKRVSMYANMYTYYSNGCKAVIYKGSLIESNKNGEGVVFKPSKIEGYVRF